MSNLGRFIYVICCLNTIFSWTLLSSVITSSAVLENGFTITNAVESFSDVGRGPICVEINYQLANEYVESINSSRAVKIDRHKAEFEDCFRGVANGTFRSFVTDGPILRYKIKKLGRTDMSAVDQNSEIYYGFAFNRAETLKREAVVRGGAGAPEEEPRQCPGLRLAELGEEGGDRPLTRAAVRTPPLLCRRRRARCSSASCRT